MAVSRSQSAGCTWQITATMSSAEADLGRRSDMSRDLKVEEHLKVNSGMLSDMKA